MNNIERIARAMAEDEGGGANRGRWMDRASAAVAEMRKIIQEADLVFSCEPVPGHPVSWNAAPAVLEIFDE